MKTFSLDQMMFSKRTLASIVKSRGAIFDFDAVKSTKKQGYEKVIAKIHLHTDECDAFNSFFYKRFHQNVTCSFKGNNTEFTIV